MRRKGRSWKKRTEEYWDVHDDWSVGNVGSDGVDDWDRDGCWERWLGRRGMDEGCWILVVHSRLVWREGDKGRKRSIIYMSVSVTDL
jgi:hypothetical protein